MTGMTELVLRPLADAFMTVGVFVALLVAPFGWARYRYGHRLDTALLRHRSWGPVVAASLTVPPGCGGAIIVMALYAKGAVSYGTAIAALVATMGDASWVLLAGDPWLTVQLKGLLLVVGAASGYAVDALGIRPRRRVDGLVPSDPAPVVARVPSPSAGAGSGGTAVLARGDLAHGGVGVLPRPPAVRLQEVGALPAALWLAIGAASLVAFPVAFQAFDPAALDRAVLGGVDPYLALGCVGTVCAAVIFVRNGCRLADDDDVSAHPGSMAQVLRHGGFEVAFITVWVAAAYLGWAFFTQLTGFDGSQLPVIGWAGVVFGALVGLVPGCAVQIVFAGLFLAGGVPLPTLVANTISQDGDALIPLLAMEQRSALLATVLTTVPALVVGSLFHLLS